MQNVIKETGVSEEEFALAYEALKDEFGYSMEFWSQHRLTIEINNYWSDRGIDIEDL